jgi:hypothetical protein
MKTEVEKECEWELYAKDELLSKKPSGISICFYATVSREEKSALYL